jgi:hypothetical protein
MNREICRTGAYKFVLTLILSDVLYVIKINVISDKTKY